MKEIYEVRTGGYRWRLLSSLADAGIEPFLGPEGFRIDLAESTPVKITPHRTVHHVRLPAIDLHVKHYLASAREWARCLVRGRRAAREFILGREVARRSVPTVEAVGFGERANRLGAPDCVLLTRTLPDTRTLLDYLETELPGLPRSLRAVVLQRLADAVGKLLARQHAGGVRYEDLHPGNMLLRFVGGEPQLFLIDLDTVQLGRPLNWARSRESLLILDRWFTVRFSRSDRRRAYRAYCRERQDLLLEERITAGELASGTQATLLAQMRQFDRRCLGGNRHYDRISGSGARGLAVTELDRTALAELLSSPDAWFDRPGAKLLKRSASSAVVEIELPVAGQRRAVIFKRFSARSWARIVASLFRTPPALRSYVFGHGFRLRGLPTPRPLAVWYHRRFGLCQEGYLLVEKVPDATDLLAFVTEAGALPARERMARLGSILEELARLLRRMHDGGLSHRDLKAANILVSPTGYVMSVRGLREAEPGTACRRDHVWFIDLVGVQRFGKVGRLRQVRDLARLHMSFLDHPLLTRTDRLRFLRTYLVWGLRGKAGWKDWWREVDQAARAKARKTRARGRIVG